MGGAENRHLQPCQINTFIGFVKKLFVMLTTRVKGNLADLG